MKRSARLAASLTVKRKVARSVVVRLDPCVALIEREGAESVHDRRPRHCRQDALETRRRARSVVEQDGTPEHRLAVVGEVVPVPAAQFRQDPLIEVEAGAIGRDRLADRRDTGRLGNPDDRFQGKAVAVLVKAVGNARAQMEAERRGRRSSFLPPRARGPTALPSSISTYGARSLGSTERLRVIAPDATTPPLWSVRSRLTVSPSSNLPSAFPTAGSRPARTIRDRQGC